MKISLFCPQELIFESKNLFQTAKNRSNAQKITDNVKNLREKQGKKRFTHVNFAIFPISRFFRDADNIYKTDPGTRAGVRVKAMGWRFCEVRNYATRNQEYIRTDARTSRSASPNTSSSRYR